jgi:hypothetical protein
VCAVKFWQHTFDLYLSNLHWQVAIDCTREVGLRALHWTILHNICPTNIHLHTMGLRPSRQCSYCDQEDFLEHFFFYCKYINSLWTEVEKLVLCNTGYKTKLKVTDVLFGCFHPCLTNRVCTYINHLILIGKMCISKVKYGKKSHILILFDNEIRIRKVVYQ